MTAKCHPAETVWGEGHGEVPAMGVVRLLGKQQPDKQYRLAPITETAAQATEAKGQKGKIAKRIFFPAALNCDSMLLLLSPDIDGHDGVPRAIQSQDRGCKHFVVGFFQLRHFSEFGRRLRTGNGAFRFSC